MTLRRPPAWREWSALDLDRLRVLRLLTEAAEETREAGDELVAGALDGPLALLRALLERSAAEPAGDDG